MFGEDSGYRILMMTRKKKEDEKVKSDGELELQEGKKNFTLEQQWDGETDILFLSLPFIIHTPENTFR